MKTILKNHNIARYTRWAFVFVCLLAFAEAIELEAIAPNDKPTPKRQIQLGKNRHEMWVAGNEKDTMRFRMLPKNSLRHTGTIYAMVSYADYGYGRIKVTLHGAGDKALSPDRFLQLAKTDSGVLTHAMMRFTGLSEKELSNATLTLRQHKATQPLAVEQVTIQTTPFENKNFLYTISDPWLGPYRGPSRPATDNTTLSGKVMVGYQGWFRTPNDPDARGWVHWGDIQHGRFSVDMWPDISQYPREVLEKACDVRLMSGKQAYLFSSAWPEVVDTHFRWMRENDIDGAFLQRFVKDTFCSISGRPERVLANVRAAANREGRIWAVEYDVSGYPDDKLLETLKTDWKWMVDTFKIQEDSNYARENEKPVVFIWGLPFANRNFTPQTADAVLDFFKNDPKYGGNFVIGGIPGSFRKLPPEWQEHISSYNCVLPWMSRTYKQDIEDLRTIGLPYYAHVKPGFSWANLKHLPTGDDSVAFTPREGGDFYWRQLESAANSGVERLFVGMFDEYDEGTAIMPMSDDTPPTPVEPGVGATFYQGTRAAENGSFARLPNLELDFSTPLPTRKVTGPPYFARMGGQITFPKTGKYKLTVEGTPGDDVKLIINGKTVLRKNGFSGSLETDAPLPARAGESMAYRLEYCHRDGSGKFRLLWETTGLKRSPVPASALKDAWGRFITNEGKPADLWLELTGRGKRLMNQNLKATAVRQTAR